MAVGKYSSEHYLEYKLEPSLGNYSEDEVSLYFERDAADSLIRHKLFLTFQEWNKLSNLRGDPSFNDHVKSLTYNEVEVIYDAMSVDCAALSNPYSKSYQNAEIKFKVGIDEYLNNNSVVSFAALDKHFSGAGQILLWSVIDGSRQLKGKFFLAINDLAKIKIDYYIKNTLEGIDVHLSCKNKGTKVNVMVLENDNRLPCLVADRANRIGDDQVLDFSQSNNIQFSLKLPSYKQGKYYALAFVNPEEENFYILNLLYEDSFDALSLGQKEVKESKHFCPYCGAPLRTRQQVAAYETNAILCSPYDKQNVLPKIYTSKGEAVSQCIYCKEDTVEYTPGKVGFKPGFARVLPKDFYDHHEFKVLLLGSVRAGKTTFLSRFFGLDNLGNATNMSLRYLINPMNHFGVSVNNATAFSLEPVSEGKYRFTDMNYYARAPFYQERAISVQTGQFPMATPSGAECHRYPFILETTSLEKKIKSYFVFYDIAGEDARSKQVKGIKDGEATAIFLFINTIKDVSGNTAIINSLKSANLPNNIPIAVILTKFDLVENQFLPSSHVVRTDYYDLNPNESYEQGIGRDILCASMEIKSFLQAESHITDLESKFSNVTYFAVSSFGFTGAIKEEGKNFNEPGTMTFNCSTKRMELPLVWVMNQFGVLKEAK